MLRFIRSPARSLLPFTCSMALLGACGGHDDGTDATTHGGSHGNGSDGSDTTAATEPTTTATTAVEPPTAPTDLTAEILAGGVHTTWKDAADDEDNFVLERKVSGEAEFATVAELPFDSVTYHDIDVTSGTTYVYRVKAVNAAGEAPSNEAMIQVP
jgi:predicted phage tail protein